MKRLLRPGLRARLIIAMVGVAVFTAALTLLLSTAGVSSRVASEARSRLDRSAIHTAAAAAAIYADQGVWNANAEAVLGHLAMAENLDVWVLDPSGAVVLGSPAGYRALGGVRASAPIVAGGTTVGTIVIAPHDGQLLTPDERRLHQEVDRLVLIAGVTASAAALVVALGLAVMLSRPLRRIRAAAERIESGDLTTRVELSSDDEVRAVGHALNTLAATLQRQDELRRESLADLAHELRTPVQGVLARIEAAQDHVLDDEAANLAAMHDEAQRLARLLDDLGALAEAERPGLLLEKRRLDLAAVVGSLVGAMAERFTRGGIELRTELSRVDVVGDQRRLEQIIANLLANALRYTEPGGVVTVRVAEVGGEALLEVSDTGVGIAPDDLPHVFTRFWRGDGSRSRATGGAGIGLAIVAELVRAHEGRVEVRSRVGEGSTFSVALPVAAAGPRA